MAFFSQFLINFFSRYFHSWQRNLWFRHSIYTPNRNFFNFLISCSSFLTELCDQNFTFSRFFIWLHLLEIARRRWFSFSTDANEKNAVVSKSFSSCGRDYRKPLETTPCCGFMIFFFSLPFYLPHNRTHLCLCSCILIIVYYHLKPLADSKWLFFFSLLCSQFLIAHLLTIFSRFHFHVLCGFYHCWFLSLVVQSFSDNSFFVCRPFCLHSLTSTEFFLATTIFMLFTILRLSPSLAYSSSCRSLIVCRTHPFVAFLTFLHCDESEYCVFD